MLSAPSPKETFVTYLSVLNIHHGYCLSKHFEIFEGMHFGEVNLPPASHIRQGVAEQIESKLDFGAKITVLRFQREMVPVDHNTQKQPSLKQKGFA